MTQEPEMGAIFTGIRMVVSFTAMAKADGGSRRDLRQVYVGWALKIFKLAFGQ
jgi:hypothetical protein